jgi:hypothetical protein
MPLLQDVVPAQEQVVRRLERIMKAPPVSVSLDGLDNWRDRLTDPKYDPKTWGMRKQRQVGNDCQGQALASGNEKSFKMSNGVLVQQSDLYAYQASEIEGGSFGRNAGSQIPAGVQVALKQGIPDEKLWPYLKSNGRWNYYTRIDDFRRARTDEVMEDQEQRKIKYAEPAPPWENCLASLVCGASLHWGTRWPLRWDSNRIVRTYRGAGSGGHATEGLFVVEKSGELLIEVLNSHGDGYFYVDKNAYEEIRRNTVYGAYLLYPKDPEELYYTGQFSLMN